MLQLLQYNRQCTQLWMCPYTCMCLCVYRKGLSLNATETEIKTSINVFVKDSYYMAEMILT